MPLRQQFKTCKGGEGGGEREHRPMFQSYTHDKCKGQKYFRQIKVNRLELNLHQTSEDPTYRLGNPSTLPDVFALFHLHHRVTTQEPERDTYCIHTLGLVSSRHHSGAP